MPADRRGGAAPRTPLGWRTATPVLASIGRRPSLWLAALGVARRLAAPGWWRRRPFLPLPDPDYWHFRLVTAYGDPPPDRLPAEDVVAYVRWCKRSGTWRG